MDVINICSVFVHIPLHLYLCYKGDDVWRKLVLLEAVWKGK